ncbi:MAG: hypothetical protein ACFFBS_03150 [Promethearchaeota archaeon]
MSHTDSLEKNGIQQENTILTMLSAFGGKIESVIRLQKLIFLATHRDKVFSERFVFYPYLYGPYSAEITDNSLDLSEQGLIQQFFIQSRSSPLSKPIRLSEQGEENACNLLDVAPLMKKSLSDFTEKYGALSTSDLICASYETFQQIVQPTMLYLNVDTIKEYILTNALHWRADLNRRISLQIPLNNALHTDQNTLNLIDRFRSRAAIYPSITELKKDWVRREIFPCCPVKLYGVFHKVELAAFGMFCKLSHRYACTAENVVDCYIDFSGQTFYLESKPETVAKWVLEVGGVLKIAGTKPVVEVCYLLGYFPREQD